LSERSNVSDVSIVETEKADLKEPLVMLGFAGAGLVGGIAITHIVDTLKMKEIAHVRSKYLPPAAVFMDGKLRPPFRIFSGQDGKLCAVVSETPLRSEGVYHIASALLDWAEENHAKEIVVLEGVAVRGIPKEHPSFCVAEPEKIKECKKKGIKMMSRGVIGGIAGSILNECLTRKITGVAFLTPAIAFAPDPEGAVALIEAINKVYGLEVDTKELLEKAEEIKKKLKELADRHRKMRKAEEKRGAPEEMYV
jgi:uncharacterized protein